MKTTRPRLYRRTSMICLHLILVLWVRFRFKVNPQDAAAARSNRLNAWQKRSLANMTSTCPAKPRQTTISKNPLPKSHSPILPKPMITTIAITKTTSNPPTAAQDTSATAQSTSLNRPKKSPKAHEYPRVTFSAKDHLILILLNSSTARTSHPP
jgi:hypothetical protein